MQPYPLFPPQVHIKNMCAWLNHSDRPQRFIQLVQRSPRTDGDAGEGGGSQGIGRQR